MTGSMALTGRWRYRAAAQRSPQRASAIEVTRLASIAEAHTIRDEWAGLAETAGARNPFTHPDWLLPWAERFIRPREQVWLLAARRHGRLVGVAPFYRRSWGPGVAHSMQLWGTGRYCGLIELPQLLLHQEQPRPVARALVARLCAGSDAWNWAEVPIEDSLWLEPGWLPESGEMAILTKTIRASVVLPLEEGTQPVMKRNLGESLRRARNRLDRAFPGAWSVDCATEAGEIAAAFPDLKRLHEERAGLAGKKRHPSLLAWPEHESFLVAAMNKRAHQGGVAIYRLIVQGVAAAALLVLRSSAGTYFLLSGINPDFWAFSPVTLLQGCAVSDAVALGHRWVNLSTGPDTAKLRWSEKLLMSTEFVLVPRRTSSRAAFAAFWQASVVAAVLRETRRHKLLTAAVSEPRRLTPLSRGPSQAPA